VQCTSPPVTPRSDSRRRCDSRPWASGKRRGVNDLWHGMKSEHCGRTITSSTCTATWPRGHRGDDRRQPEHATLLPFYHVVVGRYRWPVYRLSRCSSECHGNPRQWTSPLSGRQHAFSKLDALANGLYKLMPQRAPLGYYAPSAPTLASDCPP
jgi:hypothetical protein